MARDMEARRASQREASRRWYAGNKDKQIAANAKRRAELREWWRALKATLSCTRCGESHPACLDFHHRDPAEKDITLQQMYAGNYGKPRIMAEVAKCDVLCANCHRKHHWAETHAENFSEIFSEGLALPEQGR